MPPKSTAAPLPPQRHPVHTSTLVPFNTQMASSSSQPLRAPYNTNPQPISYNTPHFTTPSSSQAPINQNTAPQFHSPQVSPIVHLRTQKKDTYDKLKNSRLLTKDTAQRALNGESFDYLPSPKAP
jgi:hypothetical protein